MSFLQWIGLPITLILAWFFGRKFDEAKYFSEKDPLTEIYNRRIIEPFFTKITSIADRNQQMVTVFLIDVNNFKMINDQYGHQKGDDLLKHLAKLLVNCMRTSDVVARWGGDEFIIICPNITNLAAIDEINKRINERLETSTFFDLDISLSIGSATYPNEGKNLEQLIRTADKKMYKMKIEGKK
ncbi:GGDEF domain-containing protein [Bacillus rubiinfantis]|uniref:GGDEF domain-containing protein n=1 Tax=Bacillus rubiinfantis TaxID=1499680 RepID=UPI000B043BDB|nr:diguanylate cyclase [Bacillus rubiinfantis]